MFDRSLNHFPVELIDRFADTISKVVPRSPRRSVSTPEPLHGFIELCFFKPCRRRTSPFEVLIEHHLQQHQRVIGQRTDTSVQFIEGLAIHRIDLPLNDSGNVVFSKFLPNLVPSRFRFQQRTGLILTFNSLD